MAASHGSKAGVLVNGYALSQWLRSLTLSMSADMADASHFNLGSKEYVTGMTDATLAGDGLFDGSALALDVLMNAILGSATKSVAYYLPVTEALGSVVYGLVVDESTHDAETSTDDVATLAIEFQSSTYGAERCLTHKVTGSVSAGADGTSIDNAASSAFGGVAYLQVSAVSGGGTLTVKVQHSVDDSVWVDLITFAGVTAVGAQRVAVTGTVNRYTRAQHAITAGSQTYSMAFGRKVQ